MESAGGCDLGFGRAGRSDPVVERKRQRARLDLADDVHEIVALAERARGRVPEVGVLVEERRVREVEDELRAVEVARVVGVDVLHEAL